MNQIRTIIFLIITLLSVICIAQEKTSWKNIIEKSDDNWFESEEAKLIAENVLLFQRDIGGWPKNVEMQNEISLKEKQELINIKSDPKGCTTDNGATCQEMLFLSKINKKQPNEKYQTAFLKGLMYLISAQYKNGGWPQFFPLKEGYYSHITYNDNSMVNILKLFKEVKDKSNYYSFTIPNEIIKLIETSFNKGIDCILKTQYKQKGVLTVWCAQHDKETLEPAKARAYELPSLSGKESAKITLLLMSIENPSIEIKNAIENAVKWFEITKIEGIEVATIHPDDDNLKDKVVVTNENAEPLWARFMDLKDNKPFFCDRSGKKKYSLAEISKERRNGYSWYTNEPKEVLKMYESWKKQF